MKHATLNEWICHLTDDHPTWAIHASDKLIPAVLDRPVSDQWGPGAPKNALSLPDKPHGLWFGGGAAWLEWCADNSFHLWDIRHLYRVILPENTLRIPNHAAMRAFQAEYGVEDALTTFSSVWKIHWQRVAANFDAVEIEPYQHTARISDARWYSGWDVASGCVWRGARIEYLGEVEEG